MDSASLTLTLPSAVPQLTLTFKSLEDVSAWLKTLIKDGDVG